MPGRRAIGLSRFGERGARWKRRPVSATMIAWTLWKRFPEGGLSDAMLRVCRDGVVGPRVASRRRDGEPHRRRAERRPAPGLAGHLGNPACRGRPRCPASLRPLYGRRHRNPASDRSPCPVARRLGPLAAARLPSRPGGRPAEDLFTPLRSGRSPRPDREAGAGRTPIRRPRDARDRARPVGVPSEAVLSPGRSMADGRGRRPRVGPAPHAQLRRRRRLARG